MTHKPALRLNAATLSQMSNHFEDQFKKIDNSLHIFQGVINDVDNRLSVIENSFQLINQMISRRGWLVMTTDEKGNTVLKDKLTVDIHDGQTKH